MNSSNEHNRSSTHGTCKLYSPHGYRDSDDPVTEFTTDVRNEIAGLRVRLHNLRLRQAEIDAIETEITERVEFTGSVIGAVVFLLIGIVTWWWCGIFI